MTVEQSLRIVVVDDYDLADGMRLNAVGEYPRHLIFGVQRLAALGHRLIFAEDHVPPTWRRPGKRRVIATAIRGALLAQHADVLYSTYTYGAVVAGWLRVLTGRPGRIVTVVHGLPEALVRRPWIGRLLFAGHDVLAFLSPRDLDALKAHLPAGQEAFWIPWGPESTWADEGRGIDVSALLPAAARDGQPFALAVGRSLRDYETLAKAQELGGFPLVMVPHPDSQIPSTETRAVHAARDQFLSLTLPQIKALYLACSVVVLPLQEHSSLNGLSVLGEAVAADKPVVMTETASMGAFAAELPGRVFLVSGGDAEAMSEATQALLREQPVTPEGPVPNAEAFEERILAAL